jgi:WD40 repeat protein
MQPLLAVTCEDGHCRLVDIEGKVLKELPVSSRGQWAEHLAWSADGELLVAAAGKQARVFSVKGEPILETDVHPSTVTGVAVLRDSRAIVTSCYGGARLWPLKAGEPSKLLSFQGSLISLAVSLDSSVVACGSQDASVHFWRLGDGKDSEMTGYPAKPRELAWSHDSRLLATGGGHAICVWNFGGSGPEGTSPLQLKGHEDLISTLHFASTRNWLASGSRDRDILLWLPDEGVKPVGLASLKAAVTHVRFDATAHFLAAADALGNWALWKRVIEN